MSGYKTLPCHGTTRLRATRLILIAVIGFGPTSPMRRCHDLTLACDERSAEKSHSNQYQMNSRSQIFQSPPGVRATFVICVVWSGSEGCSPDSASSEGRTVRAVNTEANR